MILFCTFLSFRKPCLMFACIYLNVQSEHVYILDQVASRGALPYVRHMDDVQPGVTDVGPALFSRPRVRTAAVSICSHFPRITGLTARLC